MQPLRFTDFKGSQQQQDPTINQVVRALEAVLSQRVSEKKSDKMQYTRMGKRSDAMDKRKMQYTRMGKRSDAMGKRESMDKMQYTRMGKRGETNLDQMEDLDDNMEEVEERMMRWGLLGKREANPNKMQFTRMGKRENRKMQYTRMGKRNLRPDEELSGKTSTVKIFP